MNHDSYDDSYIRGILNTVKTIAMVGISPKDNRPSYFAFKYLIERGYNVIPINPGQAGKETFYRQIEMNVAQAYEFASEVMVRNMMLADAAEGMSAFVEKRPAKWEDS